jgi:hypothetical protein
VPVDYNTLPLRKDAGRICQLNQFEAIDLQWQDAFSDSADVLADEQGLNVPQNQFRFVLTPALATNTVLD